MNGNIFIAVMLLSTLVTFNKSWAGWDATNFSAEGRKWQPVPTGYGTPGKDNGPGIGTHAPGEDCGICHKPGGKAPNHVFTMSGTLYEDRAARKPLKGGEVILQDINGKVISMTSNNVGNFWTYSPIGSDPYGVIGKTPPVFKLYTSDTNGNLISKYPNNNADYPQAWLYKTWVKNGDHVLPMVTIAPVGGTTLVNGIPDTTSRMSCSMHHAPMGTRGALWASTKSTLPSYPATGLSFKKHVLPILMNKCVPCHIPGNTMTRIVTKSDLDTPSTMVEYSYAHDLTSYAGSSVTTTDGTNGTKKGASYYATGYNSGNADSSALLIKTRINGQNHGGGWFWTENDGDYKAIRQWIVEGGQNN